MDQTGSFILAAIFVLVFACMQSHDANRLIRRVNEETPDNFQKRLHPLAPFVELIVVIGLLVIALLFNIFGG